MKKTIGLYLVRVIRKVTLSSHYLWASFSHPMPSFNGMHKVKEIWLNLSVWNAETQSIQCTRFESNNSSCIGRSSENIYGAMVKALRNKERQDETQFTTKIDGFDGFWEYFTYSLVMKNILKIPHLWSLTQWIFPLPGQQSPWVF